MADYLLVGRKDEVIDSLSLEELHDLTLDEISLLYDMKVKGELFEVLTEKGMPTGLLKPREYVHEEGDWHGSFHLHIYGVFDGEPYILFQKRSMEKDVARGVYDVMVGGHYGVGEGIECGIREAKEEIGLIVGPAELQEGFIGRRKIEYKENDAYNREFQDIHVIRCDQPLSRYKLQREELDGIIRVKLRSFLGLAFMGHPVPADGYFFNGAGLSHREIKLTEEEFLANQDDYYFKAAEKIQQMHEGLEFRLFGVSE